MMRGMPFDRHDLLERSLDRQLAWIRASDAKISMLLPINTALLAVLAAQLGQIHATPVHWLLAAAASLPCLVSFAASVRAAMPLLRPQRDSLFYFLDVAEHTPQQFRDRFRALDEEAALDDLAAQVHLSATAARAKMRHARNAYRALFTALPFWIAALYFINGSGPA